MQCRPPDGVLEFLRLERCAECITRSGRVVRSYGDLLCCTIGITVVIVAILYVAFNALDMLTAAIFVLLHFHFFFPPCGFVQKTLFFCYG